MTEMERWLKLPWLQRLYSRGGSLWSATYRRGVPEMDCLRVVVARLGHITGLDPVPPVPVMDTLMAAKWVDGACRTIVTSSKYFSAMAATSINQDALLELRVPWPAFVVEVPPGLLVSPDGDEYRYITCAQFDNIETVPEDGPQSVVSFMCVHTAEEREAAPTLSSYEYGTLADLLAKPPTKTLGAKDGEYWIDSDPGDDAIRAMCMRAVAGLLFTMQHTTNFQTRGYSAATRGSLRSAPPPHRVVFVGSNIRMDCSPAIREAASGRGAYRSPSVQTLVRGHIKRQVVGHGRHGRKVIWVEPYWRGPEDAPILSRPYRVGA